MLAIALTFGGMIGKVFLEVFRRRPATSAGAVAEWQHAALGAFHSGTLPACATDSPAILVVPLGMRDPLSVILGFVGAGDPRATDGAVDEDAGRWRVIVFLLTFMLLVAAADWVSRRLRAWMA